MGTVTGRDRAASWVGVLAPAIFVVSFLLHGMRPRYDPVSQFVSELSLGPSGWVQMATFVVSGAGFIAFGLLAAGLSRWVAAGFVVMGACLAASGFFRTDPSAMFDHVTPEGTVHGVLGAIVFALFPVICFLSIGRLRRGGHPRAARVTLVVGILLVVGIGLLKYSQLPDGALFDVRGLVQRATLVLFMAWSAVFALVVTGAWRDRVRARDA